MKMRASNLAFTAHLSRNWLLVYCGKVHQTKTVLGYQYIQLHIAESFLALEEPQYLLFQESGYIRWIDFITSQLCVLWNRSTGKYLVVFIPSWTTGACLRCRASMMPSWQIEQAQWLLLPSDFSNIQQYFWGKQTLVGFDWLVVTSEFHHENSHLHNALWGTCCTSCSTRKLP